MIATLQNGEVLTFRVGEDLDDAKLSYVTLTAVDMHHPDFLEWFMGAVMDRFVPRRMYQ